MGWWAPEYGRASPFQLESNPREDLADQHHDKRRRSDEPPAHDGEELAVLRWQAQSRNASYPVNDSISGPGRPALLHPSSAHMSRHAVSGPSWESPGHRPPHGMRSSSLAGRQLALSFADLTASEIPPDTRSSPVPFDRRASLFPPTEENRRGSLVALGHSLSGPPTPDRASPRRSSLTEMIMAQAGDSVTMATANHSEGTGFGVSGGVPPAGPVASPVGRRPSRPLASKIPPADEGVDDVVKLEPVRSGMDVLADSASRLAEERKPQVRKDSTLRVGGTGPRYACQYCAKTFTRPSSLRIHTHSREFFPAKPV